MRTTCSAALCYSTVTFMHAKISQNLAQTHCGLMQNSLKTTATTKPPAELAIKNPLKIKQREREKSSSDDFLIHNQPQ